MVHMYIFTKLKYKSDFNKVTIVADDDENINKATFKPKFVFEM